MVVRLACRLNTPCHSIAYTFHRFKELYVRLNWLLNWLSDVDRLASDFTLQSSAGDLSNGSTALTMKLSKALIK